MFTVFGFPPAPLYLYPSSLAFLFFFLQNPRPRWRKSASLPSAWPKSLNEAGEGEGKGGARKGQDEITKKKLTCPFLQRTRKSKPSRVVVRLRPLSPGEESKAAAASAAPRCAQPTPCGKGLVLGGVGSAAPSTATTNAATATSPTAAAAPLPPSSSGAASNDASFSFPDGVLGEEATQKQLYETVSEVVEGVLLGKPASIVAYGEKEALFFFLLASTAATITLFSKLNLSPPSPPRSFPPDSMTQNKHSKGQTGAGKTHTLFGSSSFDDGAGIAPRALSALCRALVAAGGAPAGASLTLSAVEIYCDKVRCLLTSKGGGANKASAAAATAVTVGAASAADGGGVTLQGAAACKVNLSSAAAAAASVLKLLAAVARARVVASTGMNDASSRSHAVIVATVTAPLASSSISSSSSATLAKAKLALVDLAGSERTSRAQATGSVASEGRAIKASLTALGKVVAALAEEGGAGGAAAGSSPSPSSSSAAPATGSRGIGHVPYRDSQLTRVLRDCLDGSSRVAFLVCASPAAADARETLGSLRFGARARARRGRAGRHGLELDPGAEDARRGGGDAEGGAGEEGAGDGEGEEEDHRRRDSSAGEARRE